MPACPKQYWRVEVCFAEGVCWDEVCLLQGCCLKLTHLFSLAICLTCALRYEVSESRRWLSIWSCKAQALVKQIETKARMSINHLITRGRLMQVIRDIQNSEDTLVQMHIAVAKNDSNNSSTGGTILRHCDQPYSVVRLLEKENEQKYPCDNYIIGDTSMSADKRNTISHCKIVAWALLAWAVHHQTWRMLKLRL